MGIRFRRLISPGTLLRVLFSLALAFIIWGFIVWETNPEETRTIPNVAVTTENLPQSMRLVNKLPTVSVTLFGPQDVMKNIVSTEISASVDLSSINRVGTYDLKVEVSAPDGLRKVEVDPTKLQIELDAFTTREFDVELIEPTARPANVSSVDLSTPTVEIRGSRSKLNQIDHVEVPLSIDNKSETYTDQIEPVPVTTDGDPVSGDFTLEPDVVNVTVTFQITERAVPIEVVCSCVEDDQLKVRPFTEAAAIPSTVQVSGPEALISELQSVKTNPVDVSGLSESGWILDVGLDLSALSPEITVSETSVDVWVPIGQERLIFQDVEIQVINVLPGTMPTISAPGPAASFVVKGPQSALNALEGTTPEVIANADGRSPGTYQVQVQVVLPQELTYAQLNPAQVTLTISPLEPAASGNTTESTEQNVGPVDF